MAIRLTKNFTLEEFIKSKTAERLGIDNTPSETIIGNLKALAVNVLQPIRDYVQVPLRVNSGYRCPTLNKIVGGKSNSQHLRGEAADIVPIEKLTVLELYNAIKNMREEGLITIDQCIHEMSHEVDWVHVSYKKDKQNRNMFITLKV